MKASFTDIKRQIMDIAEKSGGGVNKGSTCQYKGTEKYCKATTNTSCDRCGFYSPTTQSVFTSVYEEMQKANDVYKRYTEALADLEFIAGENPIITLWQITVNSCE